MRKSMSDPERVVLAGDWHGSIRWAEYVIGQLPTLLPDEKRPLILHTGDFGVWPGVRGQTFLEAVDRALKAVNGQLWFVDGNHEWHPKLRDLQELRSSVIRMPFGPTAVSWQAQWLPRGYRWTWHGKSWLALGGAVSVDQVSRTEGEDWWPEEEINEADIERALKDGPVDAMLCHDAPTEVQLSLDPWPKFWDVADEHRSNQHRARLQGVVNKLEPELLVHGHYHRDVRQDLRTSSQRTIGRVIGLDRDGMDNNYTVLDTRTLKEA
jgi:hypothetical protein